MSEYAIKIDLTDFFTDERKWALILVDANWNCVEDLEQRVEFLFKLDGIHFLTNDGCFVPSQEPIRVISSADTLKAFVLNTPKSTEKEQISVVEGTRKENKRKLESLEAGFVSSTPSQTAKRCKKLKKQKSPQLSNEQQIQSLKIIPKLVPGSFSNSTLVNVLPGIEEDAPILNSSIASQHSANLQGKENSLHPTHIHFSNQQQDDSINHTKTIINESNGNLVFRCALMDMPTNKARTFDLRPKNSSVEILEHIRLPSLAAGIPINIQQATTDTVLAENVNNSVEHKENTEFNESKEQKCDESSVILLDDSQADDSLRNVDVSDLEASRINEKSDISLKHEVNGITKMLENSVALENLPLPGDIVLFKLFLTSSKISKVTEYIVASCDYVNKRSKLITFSLISFPDETVSLLKKWSASMDDSTDNVNKIILKVSEMVEPRLLKT